MGYPHKPHPKETVVLSQYFGDAEARTLKGWTKRGGYEALTQALAMDPARVTDIVKESGLRGRGGAGFPTGLKWSFMPKEKTKPHYLCVNADESEPGTFKDREIMRWTPHALLEGTAIAAHAIRAEIAYVYIRGEFTEPWTIMERALVEANGAGLFGNIKIYLHRGAGAYICGEETALMNSIEGKRGNPRIKPPFPAAAGLFGMPTTINNVETLAAVPHIIKRGAAWYKGMCLSNAKSTGTKLFSVCGHVQRPGNYEVTMGFPLKDLLYDMCGGRPHAQGLHSGRLIGADSHARRDRSVPPRLRGRRREGIDARLGRRDRLRRFGRHGLSNHAARPLLRARVVRAVHAMPRGHGMDHEDPRADSGGAGEAEGPRPVAGPVGEHDGQDDLRALRFVRGAGGKRHQEIPRGIRSLSRRQAPAGTGGVSRETGNGKRET
jgi:hypothetical protein